MVNSIKGGMCNVHANEMRWEGWTVYAYVASCEL